MKETLDSGRKEGQIAGDGTGQPVGSLGVTSRGLEGRQRTRRMRPGFISWKEREGKREEGHSGPIRAWF